MLNGRIELILDDITKLSVDVIVNAANHSLLGGGGVDGAIHRAAGPGLLEACRLLGGCKTGEAKITKGFNLPTKYIIHTVGPVWHDGRENEESLLSSCYHESLRMAVEHQCKTIAFPNISTGVYHFPKELAAEIATREVKEFIDKNSLPEKIIFVCFDSENFGIYKNLLGK